MTHATRLLISLEKTVVSLVVINKIVCQLQPLTLFDAFHLFEIVSVPGTYIGCWQRARPAEFAGVTIT